MMMGQITCLICVSIACIYCLFVIHDRYKLNKKEDKTMGNKGLSSDDSEMLRFAIRYIEHFIDYSEIGGSRESYTDKIYEVEYEMDFKSVTGKKLANILYDLRRGFNKDKYCIVMQLSKSLYDMRKKDDYVTIKLIVVDQKYNRVSWALKEVFNSMKKEQEIKPMNEKQNILNDIEEAQRKLDEARKKLDEYNTEYKRWKPKESEAFWYIDSSGSVNYTRFMSGIGADTEKFENYNCFKTEGEALQEAEKILVRRQLEDIAKRLNKGEKIDWNDVDQNKYFILFNHWQDTIILEHGWKNKCCGAIYCLDKNFLDIAKREIGEDRLIKYIRGEG